jgi:hypothetical protein
MLAFSVVWRGAAHDVAPRTAGVQESLQVIDASLRALDQPPSGTTEARVIEETAYLLQLRGRVAAESDPLSRIEE